MAFNAQDEMNIWDQCNPDKPLRLGLPVVVSSSCEFSRDWQGQHVITGLVVDRDNKLNITIAPELISQHGCDHVDGWSINDLIAV